MGSNREYVNLHSNFSSIGSSCSSGSLEHIAYSMSQPMQLVEPVGVIYVNWSARGRNSASNKNGYFNDAIDCISSNRYDANVKMRSEDFGVGSGSGYSLSEMVRGYGLIKTESSLDVPVITHTEYIFDPTPLIRFGHEGQFIGAASELQEYVEEAFMTLFGTSFPKHIDVAVLEEKEFRKIAPYSGTIGLSINRGSSGGVSQVFVLAGSLARVMLTLGHELGHVLSLTLGSIQDEEAKAYSFSLAWMNVIKAANIGGLSDTFIFENPAKNGVHNIAYSFVMKLVDSGRLFWDIYSDFVGGELRCDASSSRM